ncbi:MAG: hypothetical protein HKN35_04740 [Woeseia sp.]|nr:hypothetical protein [Woeseia sp.]MBT8097218.1 hypothetical protein [Woeseia sp.]NNE60177.1 hypothetical protein [Woeseia sp.]NNL55411.1 hypothetical protein [Woeseia sp.]
MTETDQQKKWLETMRQRAELMNGLYERIGTLSEQRNRKEIIRVASETLEASPIENGNEVKVGSLEIKFNDDNEVVDIRSDDGTSSFSVKPLTGKSAG